MYILVDAMLYRAFLCPTKESITRACAVRGAVLTCRRRHNRAFFGGGEETPASEQTKNMTATTYEREAVQKRFCETIRRAAATVRGFPSNLFFFRRKHRLIDPVAPVVISTGRGGGGCVG